MVKCKKNLLAVLLSFTCVCSAVPTGYIASNKRGEQGISKPYPFAVKRTWTPSSIASYGGAVYSGRENLHYAPNAVAQPVSQTTYRRYSKKSELPEKVQIKFMKSLLGKVKNLLNHTKKDESSSGKVTETNQKKILASSNGNMYSILGDKVGTKGNEYEKSVNVISIPIDALGKITTKTDHSKVDKPIEIVAARGRDSGVALHRSPEEGSETGDQSTREVRLPGVSGTRVARLVPILLESKGRKSGTVMLVNPQTRTLQPLQSLSTDQLGVPVRSTKPFVPRLVLERHGAITREHGSEDESMYRDIGHIPGESVSGYHSPEGGENPRYHASEGEENLGEASVRHKRPELHRLMDPVRFRGAAQGGEENTQNRSEQDNNDYDDDDDEDDYDDDDDDDYEDDEDDDDADNDVARYDGRMRAEAREIAATRNRLYSMLPGNDPMYRSESRGLGMNMMQMRTPPEAFLGNPMLHGMGFSRNAFAGAAMVGEHADNSKGRGTFMLDNQGKRQPFGGDFQSDTGMPASSDMRASPFNMARGDFSLGGSPAEAMSPNEVSFLMQKPGSMTAYNQQSQRKNRIYRPKHKQANVLLKVNGRPIGDSSEMRSHIENGFLVKGKEKVIKSKGPMNVKISKATDGVHSKVVDITSPKTVNVLEAKSKIAKT